MKSALLLLAALASTKARTSNPLTGDVHRAYTEVRDNILRSAEKMPAENYDFRPARAPSPNFSATSRRNNTSTSADL